MIDKIANNDVTVRVFRVRWKHPLTGKRRTKTFTCFFPAWVYLGMVKTWMAIEKAKALKGEN